jgi:phage terminase Nu1 subunit (DNA packaging protein)
MTLTALGEALGIDARAVARYAKRGMPVHSVEAARQWRAKNVRARVANGKTKPGKAAPNAYQDARTRWAISEAEQRELEVLERRGVLVSREQVRAEVARYLVGLRQALLQLPARLQSVLAAETDETKVHDLLQDEVDGILSQIARGH